MSESTLGGELLLARRCMRDPIDEIFAASRLLDQAADAHLAGNFSNAAALIRAADLPAVRAWTESLWGSKKATPDQHLYHRYRKLENTPVVLSKSARIQIRMPSAPEQVQITERYGRHCVFCGIPLIRKQVRVFLKSKYPDDLSWGRTNLTQHSAFQCMWFQFDHILPHSRGGNNDIENVVPACAPCNFGRMQWTLEEVGLIDPRTIKLTESSWDGLERLILKSPPPPKLRS